MHDLTEDWPEIRPPRYHRPCACADCRAGRTDRQVERLASQSLSTALRHAQDLSDEAGPAPRIGSPGPDIKLPGIWSGWKGPTSVQDVLAKSPPYPFGVRDGRMLYRIYEEGRNVPLYIGSAKSSTIKERVASHFRPLLTKKKLTLRKTKPIAALQKLSPADALARLAAMDSEIEKMRLLLVRSGKPIRVAYGTVQATDKRYPVDAKLLHAFELALQVLERPSSYVGSVRTFEAVRRALPDPGAWLGDFAVNNMKKDAAMFQRRAAGAPRGKGYYVKGVQFDGFKDGKLVEAKFYRDDGRFARDPAHRIVRAASLLDQARRQLAAAGPMPVEWRVAGRLPAALIGQLFRTNNIPIPVRHVPG